MYEKVAERIAKLRRLGAPERQYLHTTPFDGQGLVVVYSLDNLVDELAASVDPSPRNNFYDEVFKSQERLGYNSMFALAGDENWVIPYLNANVGQNAGMKTPIAEMRSAANFEARLIVNPLTPAIIHAFFVPSRAYVERLKERHKPKPK